jgi:hypothetical protein
MTIAMFFPEDIEVENVNADDDLGRPVRIKWIDSGLAVGSWTQARDLPDDVATVESIGMWMGENDHVVYLAGTRDVDNENWLNCQLIWKRAIIEKEWLT